MAQDDTTPALRGDGRLRRMPLGAHLEELRLRLIICLVAVAVTFIACWIFRYRLMIVLMRPHVQAMRAFGLDERLRFSGYFESVVPQLKACLIAAFILAAPVVIYQAWAFVAPGLFPRERYKVVWLGAACMLCLAAGVCFGYFLFVPVALRYLVSLAPPGTAPMLMISPYLTVLLLMTFALGVAFQTPVVIFYLVRWGIVSVESLQRHRKAVILGAFVVGAVLTPPDPLTQVMMAVTLIVLYDLGGLVARPTRATLAGFFRFTGAIMLVGIACVAWLNYWPVAGVTVLEGSAEVGGRRLGRGDSVRLRRGDLCRVAEGAWAKVSFGRSGPVVYLKGPADLRVRDGDSVTLESGRAMVVSPRRAAPLEVLSAAATVTLAGARAEVTAPAPDSITVTVFEGEVEARSGGTVTRIMAGRKADFFQGGRPVDTSEAEQEWGELMKADVPEPSH